MIFFKDSNNNLQSIINKLIELKERTQTFYQSSPYKDNDFRKTTFIKMNQIFSNYLITIIITNEKNDTIKILSKYIEGLNSKHIINLLFSGYRTLFSESIELVENLIKPIYDKLTQNKPYKYVSLGTIIQYLKENEIINDQENKCLEDFKNFRNSRHRNFIDHKKTLPLIIKTQLHISELQKFDTLLTLCNKIIDHPRIKELNIIEDLIIKR